MEIRHRTTIADKIREIKKITKYKQKDIAVKLGVTEKTVSLWANSKTRPSEIQEEKINTLYHEALHMIDRKSHMDDLIAEMRSDFAEMVEGKEMTDEEILYYGAKRYVMEMEQKNDGRIYLYPTYRGKEDEWYKLNGKSLLFYKYLLAKRLGRTVNIQDDTDKNYKVRTGIGVAKWGGRLIAEVQKLGYGAERIEHGVIVINLGKKFTKKEIRDLAKLAEEEKGKLRKVIKPKKTYPRLHMAICELLRMLPPKLRRINRDYRETIGAELVRATLDLEKYYYGLANGRIEKRDAKRDMLERVDDLMAITVVIDESNILTLASRTRMGEGIVKIRNEIEAVL